MEAIKKKILVLVTILMLGCFTGLVSASKIDVNVDVNVQGTITVGEDFYVEITLTNDDNDNLEADDEIDIKIWIDDVLVHEEDGYELGFVLTPDSTTTINISSKHFEVDNENIWEDNLMNYRCDEDIEVKAEVSGDVRAASEEDKFDLDPEDEDNELSFEITPEYPKVDDEITIKVEDEDGDELEDAYVKVTRLEDNEEWDPDDKYWDDRTDKHGEVELTLEDEREFRGDPYSKYQIDVWVRDGYCKVTEYFDSRRILSIKEIPAEAFVGKAIKVKIEDDKGNVVSGARLALSKAGSAPQFFTTDLEGYVSFTLNEVGSYTLMASKSGYTESEIIELEVKVRGTVGISIMPENPVVGEVVKVVVTDSEGALLPGAKVEITKPDGSKEPVKTTPDTGQISYTPNSQGEYQVKVEEASHSPKETSFSALNEFTITLPKKVELYKELVVVVKNQEGLLVEDATVSVSGTTLAGKTTSDGKFSFTLEEPRDYTLTVKKEGFRDKSEAMATRGEILLKLSSEEVEVDKEITFTVMDSRALVLKDTTIEVTKPDGSKETVLGNSYTPPLPGDYQVTATKGNYQPGTGSFKVKALPLEVKVQSKGGKLTVVATSRGKPVKDLSVLVETLLGSEDLSTDELGKAEIEFENITKEMEVTIKVTGAKYEEKIVEKTISPGMNIPWEWVLGLILILLILVALYLGKKRKGIKKKGIGNSFGKGKSSLG